MSVFVENAIRRYVDSR